LPGQHLLFITSFNEANSHRESPTPSARAVVILKAARSRQRYPDPQFFTPEPLASSIHSAKREEHEKEIKIEDVIKSMAFGQRKEDSLKDR